jgi:Ion channel
VFPEIGCSYHWERRDVTVIVWGLTFRFLKLLVIGLWFFSPLLLNLLLIIMLLGYLVGKREGWSRFDSLYWAFVTATTVGYGDLRPTKRGSRVIAIVIAVLGLVTAGIVIALSVHAATKALGRT